MFTEKQFMNMEHILKYYFNNIGYVESKLLVHDAVQVEGT